MLLVYQIHFNFISIRILVLFKMNNHWNFICVVWLIDKPVIKEKSWVTFTSITIVNLRSSTDIVTGFNDKSLTLVTVIPCRLPWSSMIKHISIWYKPVCFHTFNSNTEYSTGYHHSHFWIFSQAKLWKIWNFSTN